MKVQTILTLIFTSMLLGSTCLVAQTADADCPPPSEECASTEGWTNHFQFTRSLSPDCEITANYQLRACDDGSYQIRFTSFDLPGPDCQGFTELLHQGWSLSTFVEMAQLAIIQNNATIYNFIDGVPDCETPHVPQVVVQFYSANCWVWQKCTWDIENTAPSCDTDPQPEIPPNLKVNKWSWFACGRTCCRRTYSICKEVDFFTSRDIIKVESMTRESLNTCTDQGSFTKACDDGC